MRCKKCNKNKYLDDSGLCGGCQLEQIRQESLKKYEKIMQICKYKGFANLCTHPQKGGQCGIVGCPKILTEETEV